MEEGIVDKKDYIDIKRIHISKSGKEKPAKVRYFPERQITTISQTTEDPETGELKDETVKQGMNREEIEKYFPPDKFHPKETFDKKHLISAILYEAYMKEGIKGLLEPGNRRHFWYSHLKPILLGTMGCINDLNLESAITHAWTSLVETDLITYEEMNIYSAKETGRMSIVRDSPYYNIIIGMEKQSYFKGMTWLPQLFNCTLITAGGQPSTGVLRRFFSELKALGVDLNQIFHICIASDFDPSGIDIEETFAHKVIGAIKYNGGAGNVVVHRLFVKKEQITDTILKSQGIPYSIKTSTPKAIKQAKTNWRKFVQKTGGLYLPKPEGWSDSESRVEVVDEDVDGEDKRGKIRGILEMDAFSNTIIENAIGRELLKIIRETDLDETKIMIPEIMRVFKGIQEEAAEELYGDPDDEDADNYYNKMIRPLKDDFESDISSWKDEIYTKKQNDKRSTENRYDDWVKEQKDKKHERVPELFEEKDKIEEDIEEQEIERNDKINNIEEEIDGQIEALEEQITALEEEKEEKTDEIREEYKEPLDKLTSEKDSVEKKIDEKCKDINDTIEELNDERQEKLERIDEAYDFGMEKYKEFKENHLATFNPIEEALRELIKNKIDEFDYRYRGLEKRDETRENLCDCYHNRRLLIEDNISVFEHPAPSFKGKPDLLRQAFENKDLNIGKVRDRLPSQLLDGLKDVVFNDMKDVSFELDKTVEMPDLENEIEQAKKEIEKELGEKENE